MCAGSDQTEDGAVPDVSFEEAEEDTNVADNGHDQRHNNHRGHPARGIDFLRIFPLHGGGIVSVWTYYRLDKSKCMSKYVIISKGAMLCTPSKGGSMVYTLIIE